MSNKPKVDTLIVSDIHLGFHFSRAQDVLEVLKKFDFDQLILNGDIFDDLNFNRLSAEHWEVLSYLRQLSQSKNVIWIVGNHDGRSETLSHLLGIEFTNRFIWWSHGKKFIAIHGHQFDRFMHEDFILSSIAEFFYFKIIRRLESRARGFSRWIRRTNRSWQRNSEEVAKGAIRYARLRRAQFVFCGHTHMPWHKQSKKVQYFNSGCWIEYPAHYITIKGTQVKINEVK
ncbi:MAG: metallophosphoesterase [bacterium]